MKTLFLLRHAKSSWDEPGLADFDRPLNKRGRKAARAMGKYAGREGLKPELVLCSTSRRTRETLKRFEGGLGESLDTEFPEALYLASAGTILDAIQTAPEDVASVMIVAHNPGMHHAALDLIKTAAAEDLSALKYNFPTAALAEFSFETGNWSGVNFGQGKLVRFILPRHL